MAFTTINLTEPVAADELSAYGAKPGQHDCFPGGIAVFGVAAADVSAGTAYVDPATGELTDTSASGLITVTTLADCPAGCGIYGIAQGIIPGETPEAVAYTVVS
ncbi:MAG: hypothetical protein J6R99_02655 [Alphaproteobacteria bacterium]|nr:hypothetical protein [Alphaproteobacteria bacterium]MBO7066585.1 hypothetical protein [Alphaproteobacteria bacterium]